MAKLIYSAITSLDGYIEDEDGRFDWAVPDDEVMLGWETAPTRADQPSVMRDFAEIWRAADKIVYSRTLAKVSSARTRIERHFDPGAVREMKASADRDLSVGGPEIAAQACRAGLVDECHLFIAPVLVGGGKRCFPGDVHLGVEPLEARRFGGGTVHLRYRTRT